MRGIKYRIPPLIIQEKVEAEDIGRKKLSWNTCSEYLYKILEIGPDWE